MQALSRKRPDALVLKDTNCSFSIALTELLLKLSGEWKEFFSVEMFNGLVDHLVKANSLLHSKVKVIGFLIRLLTKCNQFPRDSQPNLSKLHFIRPEMHRLYRKENEIGENYHSVYLQRLFELCVRIDIAEKRQKKDTVMKFPKIKLTAPKEKDDPKSPPEVSLHKSNEFGVVSNVVGAANNTLDERKTTKHARKLSKESVPKETKPVFIKSSRDANWYQQSLRAVEVLEALAQGEEMPEVILQEALREQSKQSVVYQSPHPYPGGAKVTGNVTMPGAQSILVSFDLRSRTKKNSDYLMFSRSTVGGDDLGIFSGEMPKDDLLIPGDRFIWSFMSDASGGTASPTNEEIWGFAFTVTAIYGEDRNLEIESQLARDMDELKRMSKEWSLPMDLELVKFIYSYCENRSIKETEFQMDQVNTKEFATYPLLCNLKPKSLFLRAIVLKYLNILFASLIKMVDFSLIDEQWSLANRLGAMRGLIFFCVKQDYFRLVLQSTQSQLARPIITLNRHRERRKEQPLFLQAYLGLKSIHPSLLRRTDRAFEVKLEKEGAQDAGGPYQESMTQFCQDLKSKELGLFIPCSNAKEETGINQDKYVPCSNEKLAQYRFVGMLIGMALRTRTNLDLSLPSVIWKPLVCQRLDRSDLEAIDKFCCQFVDSIRNIGKQGVSEKTFHDFIFETFTTTNVLGERVELKPGGRHLQVNWENRHEFTSLVEQAHLNEFSLQTEAIANGLSSIVPSSLLAIFTWQELEKMVCGAPEIDVNVLARHTEYRGGLSENDPLVQNFWKVLSSFSHEEQSRFVRFISGRSRLPKESEFTTKFQLQSLLRAIESDKDRDTYLPQAQTCFMSLSLPNYSTLEIMREKLLYAINTCREIDADYQVVEEFDHEEKDENSVESGSDTI